MQTAEQGHTTGVKGTVRPMTGVLPETEQVRVCAN